MFIAAQYTNVLQFKKKKRLSSYFFSYCTSISSCPKDSSVMIRFKMDCAVMKPMPAALPYRHHLSQLQQLFSLVLELKRNEFIVSSFQNNEHESHGSTASWN